MTEMSRRRLWCTLVPLLGALFGCADAPTATEGPAEADRETRSAAAVSSGAPSSSTGTVEAPGEAEKAPSDPPAGATPEGMVLVPPGIYLMGSPEGGSFEERPMHEVVMPATYVDITEVTVAEYARCVDAGACQPPRKDNPFCNPLDGERKDHPINCIPWTDADAFCRFAGKRLPTEREWEYAARGGAERRTFSWGEEPASSAIACYSHSGTCKVGSFAPGAFGLLDVSGNVWEWTASWYGPYPDELETGLFKVYRGGSWSRRFPKWLRNELRNRYRVDQSSAALGMRCVKTKTPLECPADTEPRGAGCVRVRGAPGCEPGYAWHGDACAPDASAVRSASVVVPSASGPAADADSPHPDEPAHAYDDNTHVEYVRTRTPANDGDCQRNWPDTPFAYRWDGGTFHSRNPVIAAAGCVKRDMGRTWTSACCRQ
jgi:formylglycine-generating enzyme required for sulfatase activity